MKVLVACEYSATVKTAFLAKGHDVTSCDLLPCVTRKNHYQGDVFDIINEDWDLIIAHPPCTYLCNAQLFRCKPGSIFFEEQQKAIAFVRGLFSNKCPRIAIENPKGILSRLFMPPSQIIYPWYFGDKHSKDICLWLKGLPPLISTCYHTKRIPMQNHVNSRMSQALKSSIKSKFFPLVAEAMANQWS